MSETKTKKSLAPGQLDAYKRLKGRQTMKPWSVLDWKEIDGKNPRFVVCRRYGYTYENHEDSFARAFVQGFRTLKAANQLADNLNKRPSLLSSFKRGRAANA